MTNLREAFTAATLTGLLTFTGCPTSVTDISSDDDDQDDDSQDDDTGDDDAGDDDTADDDDLGDDDGGDDDMDPGEPCDFNQNEGMYYIDLGCAASAEHDPPTTPGEGRYCIEARGDEWMESVWTEFWDSTSDYCEGYDPLTGEPCESDGYLRFGWDLTNVDFGWNETDGHWDYWVLDLEYIADLPTAVAEQKSAFPCEEAGSGFATWFCNCAMNGDQCWCEQLPDEIWNQGPHQM